MTYNSRSIGRVLGYEPEEVPGSKCLHSSFIRTTSGGRWRNSSKAIDKPDATVVLEFRMRHKDGSWRWLETISRSLVHDPEIAGVVVNSRDVTERRRAEHYNTVLSRLGLRLSSATSAEQAARIIVEVANELFGWDNCTLNLYSSEEDKIQPILSIDTVQGEKVVQSQPENEQDEAKHTRRALSQGAELILNEASAGGSLEQTPASQMYVPIRNRTRVIGILSIQSYQLKAYTRQDLATLQSLADHCGGALERMRVEQALRESEKRFRHLFEGSPDAVFVDDLDGRILDANPAAGLLPALVGCRANNSSAGMSPSLCPPRNGSRPCGIFTSWPRANCAILRASAMRTMAAPVPVDIRTNRIDYAGNPARCCCTCVTSPNAARRRRPSRLGTALPFRGKIPVDGMRLTDEEGSHRGRERCLLQIGGHEPAGVGGENFYRDPRPRTVRFWTRCWPAIGSVFRSATWSAASREPRVIFRGGVRRSILESSSIPSRGIERSKTARCSDCSADITEQKRLEEQLRQSQKR